MKKKTQTCSISNSLIWVDALVQLFAIEEVCKMLLDSRDTGWSSYKDNLVDLRFIHFGIPHGFLHWFKSASEEVRAELLKASSCDASVVVNALKQRVDLNTCLLIVK